MFQYSAPLSQRRLYPVLRDDDDGGGYDDKLQSTAPKRGVNTPAMKVDFPLGGLKRDPREMPGTLYSISTME